MTRLLISASISVIAVTAYAGAAFAQTSTTAASSPDNPRITCGDLASLESDEAEDVIYFLAGWQAAQESATLAPAASSKVDSADSADAGTSGSASTAAEETASTSGDSEDATVSTDTTASTASGDSGSVMASVEAWNEIDVEQLMSECQGETGAQILDVLERQNVIDQ